MKGCSKFREQLSAYIDGELGAGETGKVEEHLKACAQCNGALDDLRKTVSALNGLEQVDTPPWLTQKVMTRIKEEGVSDERQGFLEKLFRPLHVKVPLGAMATVLLAFTTYFFFQEVIPGMQNKQSEPYIEMPAKVPESQKAPDLAVAPKKKIVVKEHDEVGKVAGRPARSEMPEQKAEVSAPVKQEMRAEAGNEAPALAPAAPVERKYAETKRALKAMEYGSAQRQDSSARNESIPKAAGSSSSKISEPPMAGKISVLFHVNAQDPANAVIQVTSTLTRLGGNAISKNFAGDKTIVRAELDAMRLREFFYALKKIGLVQERMAPSVADGNNVAVTVEIIPSAQLPTDPHN